MVFLFSAWVSISSRVFSSSICLTRSVRKSADFLAPVGWVLLDFFFEFSWDANAEGLRHCLQPVNKYVCEIKNILFGSGDFLENFAISRFRLVFYGWVGWWFRSLGSCVWVLEVRDGLRFAEWADAECPTCIALFIAVHCFLVQKKPIRDARFHIHTAGRFNMEAMMGVWMKNPVMLTPQQAQKTVATTKSNCSLLLSCGNSKTETPT